MTDIRPRPNMTRIAMASAAGTVIEFYDFAVFGTASALVFGVVFFPSMGPATGLALSIATFGVAFVARPFGSILFGHLGDRWGRKRTLVTTLLIMGISTMVIGLLPTAATIGWVAPVLLVILRIFQGLAVGGEWAGASLLTAENAPSAKRGLFGLFPQLGPSVGFMLACATFLVLAISMSSESFLAWGWRIPFVASFVLVAIGLVVRLSIQESAVFRDLVTHGAPARFPFAEVVSQQWRTILLAAGTTTALFGLFYIGTTYFTSYGTAQLGLARTTVLLLNVVGGAVFVATTIVGAILSDRVGRKKIMLIGNLACLVAALAVFPILDLGTPMAFLVGLCLVLGASGISYGPMASFLPELFATRYRYSGAGFAYNLAALLGAAVTPLIATQLLPAFGSFSIGLYLALLSAASLLCLIGIRETAHTGDFSDEETVSPVIVLPQPSQTV